MDRPDDDREYIQYNWHAPAETWIEWKDSLPRDTTLYERLNALIAADAALNGHLVETVTDAGDLDELETLNLLRLKLGRCHARATVASERIRDEKPQDALVTVDKIIDITDEFARET